MKKRLKKKLKKGSMARENLISLILLLATAALLIGFVSKSMAKSSEKAPEVLCRTSVFLREKAYLLQKNVKLLSLNCKTIGKDLPKDKNSNKEDIEREMAELVRRCWWEFGNGLAKNVFNEVGGSAIRNSCFVCYSFTIKKSGDFDETNTISKEDFERFLNEKKIRSLIIKNKNMEKTDTEYSYTDYVQRKDGPGKIIVAVDSFVPLGTKREVSRYAIAFVSPEWAVDSNWYKTFVGNFLTDKSIVNYVLVAKMQDIENYCEIEEI